MVADSPSADPLPTFVSDVIDGAALHRAAALDAERIGMAKSVDAGKRGTSVTGYRQNKRHRL